MKLCLNSTVSQLIESQVFFEYRADCWTTGWPFVGKEVNCDIVPSNYYGYKVDFYTAQSGRLTMLVGPLWSIKSQSRKLPAALYLLDEPSDAQNHNVWAPPTVYMSIELKNLKGITFGSLNTRGLLHNVDDIAVLLEDSKLDILLLQETFLCPSIDNSLLDIPAYTLYRANRTADSGKKGVEV